MHPSMVNHFYLSDLRNSLWILLFVVCPAFSQDWEEAFILDLDSEIASLSEDLQGNVYLATIDDQVLKVNSTGEIVSAFSQPNLGPYTSIAAQNNLNPFLFIRDNQQVLFLDRFLANPVVYDLSQWTSGFVALATPSVDRQLWLVENFPLKITKIDRFSGNVLHEIVIQIGFELENLVHFSAQQMSLLLVDEVTGIYLFDLFGNLLYHEEIAGVNSAQIVGDQLTYYTTGKLHSTNLNSDQRSSLDLPENCSDARIIGDRFLLQSDDQLIWLRLKK